MQRYRDVVLNIRGEPVPGVSVLVKTFPGGVNASLFDDDSGTTLDNPLPTNSNGAFSFKAANGHYSLSFSGTGITAQTVSDITLCDPDDVITDALADLAESTGAAAVGFAPAGGLSASTVQAALVELDTEKASLAALAASDGTTKVNGTWFGAVVATVAQLATSAGSSLMGFIQAGTGAVAQSVQAKLRDFVSDKDFGSTGDGTTDDTAAIQAAINYAQTTGKRLVISEGDHRTTATLNITAPIVLAMEGFVRPNHSGFAFTVNQATNQDGGITIHDAKIKWYGTFGTSTAGGFDLSSAVLATFIAPHLWGLGKNAFRISEPGVVGLTITNPRVQEHVAGDMIGTTGNPFLTITQIIGGMFQLTSTAANAYDGLSLTGTGEQDTLSIIGTAFEKCRNGIYAKGLKQFSINTGYFELCTTGVVLGSGFSTNKPADGIYMTEASTGTIETSLFSQGTTGILIEGIVNNIRIAKNFFDSTLTTSINVNTAMHLGLEIGDNDDETTNKVIGYPSVIGAKTALNYTKSIVDACSSLTGWAESFDPSGTGSVALDTGWDNKNQAIKLQVTGDSVFAAKTVALDLSTYDYFVVPFYVADRSKMYPPISFTDPSIYAGSEIRFQAGSGNDARMHLSQIDYGPYPWLKTGWNYLTLPKTAFRITGTMNWAAITQLQISLRAQTGQTAVVRYGGIFGIKITGSLPFEVPNNLYL